MRLALNTKLFRNMKQYEKLPPKEAQSKVVHK